jgi:hypothetical protein
MTDGLGPHWHVLSVRAQSFATRRRPNSHEGPMSLEAEPMLQASAGSTSLASAGRFDHRQLGVRDVPWIGWISPVWYFGISWRGATIGGHS